MLDVVIKPNTLLNCYNNNLFITSRQHKRHKSEKEDVTEEGAWNQNYSFLGCRGGVWLAEHLLIVRIFFKKKRERFLGMWDRDGRAFSCKYLKIIILMVAVTDSLSWVLELKTENEFCRFLVEYWLIFRNPLVIIIFTPSNLLYFYDVHAYSHPPFMVLSGI